MLQRKHRKWRRFPARPGGRCAVAPFRDRGPAPLPCSGTCGMHHQHVLHSSKLACSKAAVAATMHRASMLFSGVMALPGRVDVDLAAETMGTGGALAVPAIAAQLQQRRVPPYDRHQMTGWAAPTHSLSLRVSLASWRLAWPAIALCLQQSSVLGLNYQRHMQSVLRHTSMHARLGSCHGHILACSIQQC